MAMKSGAVSVEALVALRKAEVALAQAQLALAQAQAGVASAPRAPRAHTGMPPASVRKQAAAAQAQAQVPARKERRPFTGELTNPDAPASSRQLWMLHILTGTDTRGATMTRQQASDAITAAKAAKGTPAQSA